MWMGGRAPKSTIQYLAEIEISRAAYPNFRFRQLQRTSDGFRFRMFRGMLATWYVEGSDAKVPDPKFI